MSYYATNLQLQEHDLNDHNREIITYSKKGKHYLIIYYLTLQINNTCRANQVTCMTRLDPVTVEYSLS